MISKKLAICLSFILGPFTWLPFLLLVFIFKSDLTKNQIGILLPSLFILLVGIPLSYILLAYKGKSITDIDLSKRQERFIPLIIAFISLLISFIVVKLYGSPFLQNLILLFILLLCVNGVITLFWKISFHMAANVVGSLLLNFLYKGQLPILYLTIPIIYWSRLKLKKHTHSQLIAALFLNAIIVLFFLKRFD